MSLTVTKVGQSFDDELTIHYSDDIDPEKAGQGLAFAPLIFQLLGAERSLY